MIAMLQKKWKNLPAALRTVLTLLAVLVLAALLLTSRKIVPAIEWAQTLKGTADISKQVEKGKSCLLYTSDAADD